jgi:hypothetical protein
VPVVASVVGPVPAVIVRPSPTVVVIGPAPAVTVVGPSPTVGIIWPAPAKVYGYQWPVTGIPEVVPHINTGAVCPWIVIVVIHVGIVCVVITETGIRVVEPSDPGRIAVVVVIVVIKLASRIVCFRILSFVFIIIIVGNGITCFYVF